MRLILPRFPFSSSGPQVLSNRYEETVFSALLSYLEFIKLRGLVVMDGESVLRIKSPYRHWT